MLLKMAVYDKFSQYYDELYSHLDYEADCEHLIEVFNRYCAISPKTILDLGCGTGTHALVLAEKGFYITGIDMSKRQIESAKKKSELSKAPENLDFIHSDMRDFSLDKQFDVAVSLFGSFCYLLEDEDIQRTLENIYNHLNKDGILVFEFWHSGGVYPEASAGGHYTWNRFEGEKHTIIRLDKSVFNHETSTLDIEFDFYVLAKRNVIDEFKETHKLRVFSLGEIRTWMRKTGFDEIGIFEMNSFNPPKTNSFRPTAIARKVS